MFRLNKFKRYRLISFATFWINYFQSEDKCVIVLTRLNKVLCSVHDELADHLASVFANKMDLRDSKKSHYFAITEINNC